MSKNNNKNMDRNLKYNGNEKRVSDNYMKNGEVGEDATMYGEFIPSAFAWVPPEKQKEKAKEIECITEQKDNKVRTNDNNKDNDRKQE